MGQKCCRPTIRIDPKHITLLTLIYSEPLQGAKELDYKVIAGYLTKKGYVRTLCDHLSSHLKQINPSLLICKNKQIGARNRSPITQIYYSVITTEVILKIIWLCREIKQKQQIKEKSNFGDQLPEGSTPTFQNSTAKDITKKNHSKTSNKNKSKLKFVVSNPQFMQTEIGNTILDICSEVIHQTINSRRQLSTSPSIAKASATQFIILSNMQIALSQLMILERETKLDFKATKYVLDALICILSMCKVQKVEQEKLLNLITANQIINSTFTKQKKNSINQEVPRNTKNITQPFNETFSISHEQKYKMAEDCLRNYNSLMESTSMHIPSGTLYKDLAKVHMPKLLDYWADLVIEIESDAKSQSSKLSLVKQQNIEETQKQQKTEDWNESKESASKSIQLIKSIIQQFFNSYFSLGESSYVYRQLMIIFDRLMFSKQRIAPIQKLVFQSLKSFELRESVISKWFQYLLDYLGILITSSSDNAGSYGDSETQKKPNIPTAHNPINHNYLTQLNLPFIFQNIKSDSINWFREENICGCLKTIQRWIQTGEVNLESILNYKRTKLFVSLLINLARGEPKINQQIMAIVQFLIENDVRCFGYLIDTAVFLIHHLDLPRSSNQPEYSWDYFIEAWSKLKQNMELNSSVMGSKRQSSTNTLSIKLRSVRSSQIGIQLIPIEKFVDEIISVSSYPFLRKLTKKMAENKIPDSSADHLLKGGSYSIKQIGYAINLREKKSSKRLSQIGMEQKILEDANLSFKGSRPNSFSYEQKQINKDTITDPAIQQHKNIFQPKLNTNRLFLKSVFQQTISVLYKGISFIHSDCKSKYHVKLAGLVLASNFKSMICLASLCSQKSQLNYIISLLSKINKFLSKNYKEVKLLCQENYAPLIEMNQSRMKSLEKEEDSVHNFLGFFESEESNSQSARRSLDESMDAFRAKRQKSVVNSVNIKDVKLMQKAVHCWIYPAIHYVLISTQIVSQSYDEKNTDILVELTKQNRNYLKILVNITIKIYFKNLLHLSKHSFQMHKKSSLQSDFYQNQSRNSQSIKQPKIYLAQSKQTMEEKQNFSNWTELYNLPVKELFELFVLFSNQSVISPAEVQIEDVVEEPNKKTKRKRRYSFKSNNEKKKNQIVDNENDKALQLVEQIKICLSFLKNTTKKDMLKLESSSKMKSTAPFNKYEQVGAKQSIESVIPEGNSPIMLIEKIIFNEKLSNYFFRFVDNTSSFNDQISRKNQSEIALKRTTQKIIQGELLKSQIDNSNPIQEESQQNIKCHFFRKAFKKFYEVPSNQQDEICQSQTSPLEAPQSVLKVVKEKKNENYLQFQQMNDLNAHIIVPQIINKFEEHYEQSQDQKHFGLNSHKDKGHFILMQNDFGQKQSVFTSSQYNPSSLGSSFGSMFVEIRKH